MICLNLGCGNDYRESDEEVRWINVDDGKCKVDVALDIEDLPWGEEAYPCDQSDYFDHIYACQVLEHISKEKFPHVVREMYRISKPGATWQISVPHGLSDNFVTDFTHKMPFSTRTFDYFVDGAQLRENGIIYGFADIRLAHVAPPSVDGNQSIHFNLEVVKE